jgi:hypothetical protein
MDMVGETIEQGAGQTLIPEDAGPFLEGQIRRNDRAPRPCRALLGGEEF